jgi:4-amino-4-deoxy-L-arabinose transferase-like glycosyltransferase
MSNPTTLETITVALPSSKSRGRVAAQGGMIFATALFVRLLVLFLTFNGSAAVGYYDDAKIALNLVAGHGYSISYDYRNWLFYGNFLKNGSLRDPITEGTKPTASKQPAYPLVLALFFRCFGVKNFLAVFLVQAVLSSLTSLFMFLSGRQLSPLAALAVGVGVAVYPPFVFHSVTTPESTTLSLFLLSAAFLCLSALRQRAKFLVWAAVGLVAGAEALTEPVTIPFSVVCLCYAVFFVQDSLPRRLAGFALATALAGLLVLPWVTRNYLVFGKFPVVKGITGLVFNWGLQESGRGTWIPEQRIMELEYAGRKVSEAEEDEAIRKELRSRLPYHWREFVSFNIPANFLHFWWDVRRYWSDYSLKYLLMRRLPYILLLSLAVLPTWRLLKSSFRRPREVLCMSVLPISALVLICSLTAVYSFFGSYMSRYRLPVELALFFLAGQGAARLAGTVLD